MTKKIYHEKKAVEQPNFKKLKRRLIDLVNNQEKNGYNAKKIIVEIIEAVTPWCDGHEYQIWYLWLNRVKESLEKGKVLKAVTIMYTTLDYMEKYVSHPEEGRIPMNASKKATVTDDEHAYEGWSNKETWNVAFLINMYCSIC